MRVIQRGVLFRYEEMDNNLLNMYIVIEYLNINNQCEILYIPMMIKITIISCRSRRHRVNFEQISIARQRTPLTRKCKILEVCRVQSGCHREFIINSIEICSAFCLREYYCLKYYL